MQGTVSLGEGMQTGRSLKLIGQPGQIDELQISEKPCLEIKEGSHHIDLWPPHT